MQGLKSIIMILSLFATGLYAQELPVDGPDIRATGGVQRDAGSKGDIPAPASLTAISSTAPGGLWSSPSTWVGGVVPGVNDEVTISPGSAVVIDTNVTVANLTVGPDVSFNSGILTFDPAAARVLRVNGHLTVSGLGILTTPSTGTVTTHTISIGGNLTNNGILDISTNSNQAGAGLVFTDGSNNTFGGGGSQTDIRTITVDKGISTANTLELTVLNFTVQGSSIDTPGSGYLTLINGFFKVSGTFAGNHRTFPAAAYSIPLSAGFWLNNPNYTVTAQTGDAVVTGKLQISAGIYNVGTAATDALRGGNTNGVITIDGGSLNVSGAMRRGQFPGVSYRQRGGATTICIAGNFAPCYNMSGTGTGGSFVVQTPNPVPDENSPDFAGELSPVLDGGTAAPTAATLYFGNATTPGTGVFTYLGTYGPNIVIDTTSGPHTVKFVGAVQTQAAVRNIDIGSAATLDIGDTAFYMTGDTFVNNGTLKVKPQSEVAFAPPPPPSTPSVLNVTYSGTGSFSGPVATVRVKAASLTLDPGVSGIRARNIYVNAAQIINAYKLTLGLNDASASSILMEQTASFDVAPVFDLGTGGQKIIYEGSVNRTTGLEINPTRELVEFTHRFAPDTVTVTIAGGDLTLNGPLDVFAGVIDTGTNKINHMSGTAARLQVPGNRGYIKGTLVRKFDRADSPGYSFLVGDGHYARAHVEATAVPGAPAFVTVTARDTTLAGLPPGTSVSFSWDIRQTGAMTSRLELNYGDEDINGQDLYRMWRSTAQLPMLVPNSSHNSNLNSVTALGVTDLNGSFGIGQSPGPISISGAVMAANGVGIRNAVVTISGGTLPGPISVITGTFGTYQFSGLDPGGEYAVFVSAKRNRFTPPSQTVSSFSSVSNVNFTANPQ
jgi:hypothetical protein